MTSTLASPEAASAADAPPARSRLGTRIAALTPLWVFLILVLARGPFFWKPFFGSPPEFLGLPLGLWMIVLGPHGRRHP
jgi:hypothetical protein